MRPYWQVEIKAVDNGYTLMIRDVNTYKATETVYTTLHSALDGLRKSVEHIENSLALPGKTDESEG